MNLKKLKFKKEAFCKTLKPRRQVNGMYLPFSLVINGQAAGINILAIFIYKYNTLLILYITPYFRVVTMAERSNEIAICCVRLLEARGCGARRSGGGASICATAI